MGAIAAAILHIQHERIVARLRDAGATSAAKATRLVTPEPGDASALAFLIEHGVVIARGDRVYLSEPGLAAYLSGQRHALARVTILFAVVATGVLVLLAFRLFG